MERRRLAALSVLKRLKKHEMEISTRKLGDLRLQNVELNSQKQTLLEGVQHQIQSSNPDLTPYMRQFLPAARTEIGTLDDSIDQLQPHISALEEQIGDKFKEFKTIDIMHSALSDQIYQEQETREVATAEEILLARRARKQLK